MKTTRTFEDWMKAVDAVCYRLVGCSYQDLSDYCWMDAFVLGRTPASAARAAIRRERGLDD